MADHEQNPEVTPERAPFSLEDINVEQQWSGVIDAIEGDKLFVELTSETAQEFIPIDKSQVSPKDQGYITEGAPFEWTVGYVDDAMGRRIGVSIIEFVYPEILSEEEMRKAREAGIEGSRVLLANESHHTTIDNPQNAGKV
jgi:hypothetical protein